MREWTRYRLELWKAGQTVPVPFHVYRSDDLRELREFASANAALFQRQQMVVKLLDAEAGKVETL